MWLLLIATIVRTSAAGISQTDPRTIQAKHVEALRARADVLISAGNYPEAEKLYQEALKSDPSSADVHHQYGKLLSLMGKEKDSLVYYEKALQVNKKNAELLSDIGVALVATGNLPESIRHFEMALQCNPLYLPAYNNLGDALFRQGMYDAAIAILRRSLDYQPHNLFVQQKLQEALAGAAAARSKDRVGTPMPGIGDTPEPATDPSVSKVEQAVSESTANESANPSSSHKEASPTIDEAQLKSSKTGADEKSPVPSESATEQPDESSEDEQ